MRRILLETRPDINNLLERIAIALEKIADSLSPQTESRIPPVPGDPSLLSNDPIKPLAAANDPRHLSEFLASRDIAIKTIPPEHESDETLDKIALFIGNRLESVKGILDSIKGNMNTGRAFSLTLKNESQQTVTDTTNLCTNLYNIAFLTAYHYQKSPSYQVHATPSTSPKALNFFSGQWLERFIKSQVLSLLKRKGLEHSYICNAQITLPNGDDFELDMLFRAGNEIFWLEAKTGDYRKHIEKYSKMSKLIGLDHAHTFLILADDAVTENLTRDLGSLYGINVVRIESFAEQLSQMIPETGDYNDEK